MTCCAANEMKIYYYLAPVKFQEGVCVRNNEQSFSWYYCWFWEHHFERLSRSPTAKRWQLVLPLDKWRTDCQSFEGSDLGNFSKWSLEFLHNIHSHFRHQYHISPVGCCQQYKATTFSTSQITRISRIPSALIFLQQTNLCCFSFPNISTILSLDARELIKARWQTTVYYRYLFVSHSWKQT